MLTRIILILSALLASSAASAEGGSCPAGYYPINSPGVSGCAPMPGSGGSDTESYGPQWRDQWVALAIDAPLGAVGAAVDQPSKAAAKKEAVWHCINNGGTKKGCKLFAATWNQCLVMAWGNGYTNAFGSPDQSTAMSGAMEQCSKNAENCKIVFGYCTSAVRVN